MLKSSMHALLFVVSIAFSAIAADDIPVPQSLSKLTPEQLEDTKNFAVGNATFIIFHESGHMLVSEFGLPVLGKEEDAVDSLSSLMLLEAEDTKIFGQAMKDATWGWFLWAQASEENGVEPAYWDEHALDQQRAYAMVCMMLGKDEAAYREFAESVEYPKDRIDQCKYNYERTSATWFGLLEQYEAPEGGKTEFVVTYEEPKDPRLAFWAAIAKKEGILEMIEATYSGMYDLKDGIKVTAKSCGTENAYWHPGDRELTFCYELMAMYGDLDAKWYAENPDN